MTKIEDVTMNECTKEHGYIISVKQIIDIVDHKINTNASNIFIIKFTAETLKPKAGSRMEGEVSMIYADGLFITILDKQQMLIPSCSLKEYSFRETNNIQFYVHNHKNDLTINVGDNITAIVTASRYRNKKFSCFGSLA